MAEAGEAGQDDTIVSVSTEEPDGTVLVAVALRAAGNGTGEEGNRTFTISDAGVAVKVPAALVLAAGGGEGFASLSFARLGAESETMAALGDSGESPQSSESSVGSVQLADLPVSLVLFTADGLEWKGPLPEPLQLSIPVSNLTLDVDERGECAFWDLDAHAWSTEGVSTVSTSSLDAGVVTCETTHLSLFAFLLRTMASVFVCAMASRIFSLEGLQNLSRGHWAWSIPALLQWAVLLLAAVLLFLSWRCDVKHERYVAELKLAEEARSMKTKMQKRRSTMQRKELLPQEITFLTREQNPRDLFENRKVG